MNKVKTRINPQTGMMETVEDTSCNEDAKAKLERTKRELREMLHGTGQIPVQEVVPAPIDWVGINQALDEATPADWEEFGDDI